MEVALYFYGGAGDGWCICTHLSVLKGKIPLLLVKQRAMSELDESYTLVSKCLSFTLSFWFSQPFPPPFSCLHCSWEHLDHLKSVDHVLVEGDSHVDTLTCMPCSNCSCEVVLEAQTVFSSLHSWWICSVFPCVLSSDTSAPANCTPLLDPLCSLSSSISPFYLLDVYLMDKCCE